MHGIDAPERKQMCQPQGKPIGDDEDNGDREQDLSDYEPDYRRAHVADPLSE